MGPGVDLVGRLGLDLLDRLCLDHGEQPLGAHTLGDAGRCRHRSGSDRCGHPPGTRCGNGHGLFVVRLPHRVHRHHRPEGAVCDDPDPSPPTTGCTSTAGSAVSASAAGSSCSASAAVCSSSTSAAGSGCSASAAGSACSASATASGCSASAAGSSCSASAAGSTCSASAAGASCAGSAAVCRPPSAVSSDCRLFRPPSLPMPSPPRPSLPEEAPRHASRRAPARPGCRAPSPSLRPTGAASSRGSQAWRLLIAVPRSRRPSGPARSGRP